MKKLLCAGLGLLLAAASAWAVVLPFRVAQNATVVAAITPSRTTGTAPLGVFFDALNTASSLTTQEFRDVECSWDFNDPDGGSTWAYGTTATQSKNVAYGLIAGHVFETAGTYNVVVTCRDSATSTDTETVQIVVTAADVTFSGANTHCFSNGSDFTGCPGGATTHASISNFDTVRGFIASGRRLLLRRGDTFTTSGGFNNAGNWQLGAYGSGAKPLINANSDGVHLISQACSGGPYTDVTIMDLSLSANGHTNNQGISYEACGSQPQFFYSNFLIDRVDVTGVHRGFETFEQHNQFVVNSTVSGDGYTLFSGGMYDSLVAGNLFTETTLTDQGEGNIRWGNYQKLVVSNNTLNGGQAGRQHIKMGAGTLGAITSHYVIMADNNIFGGGDIWPVNIGPQNASNDERAEDFIIERNWIKSASLIGAGAHQLISAWAKHGTIRGNIMDMSLADPNDVAWCILIEQRGVEPVPDDVDVYNNTCYSSLAGNGSGGVGFYVVAVDNRGAGATNIRVRNNFGSAPNWAQDGMLWDPNSRATASNNTQTNSPNFVTTPTVNPVDFQPGPTSSAVNTGTPVPVWSDFFKNPRTGTYDLGAVNP